MENEYAESEPLTDEDRAYRGLRTIAQKHSGGNLRVMELDATTYLAQSLGVRQLTGTPERHVYIEKTVLDTGFEPKFPELITQAQSPVQFERIKTIGEMLKGHDNIVLVTNHSELTDVAKALAVVHCELSRNNYTKYTNDFVLGKMGAFLEYKFGDGYVPITDLLTILCHRISLSIPNSKTTEEAGIPRNIRTHYNKKLLSIWKKQMEAGGVLLTVAASGTHDSPQDDDPNTIVMHNVTPSTAGLLKDAYIVPIAIWTHEGEPFFEICSTPEFVEADKETDPQVYMDKAMRKIAARLTKNVHGKRFIYEMTPPEPRRIRFPLRRMAN